MFMYKTILKVIKEQRGFFKCNISLNRIQRSQSNEIIQNKTSNNIKDNLVHFATYIYFSFFINI